MEWKVSDIDDNNRDMGDDVLPLHAGMKINSGVFQTFLHAVGDFANIEIADASVVRNGGFHLATRKASNLITLWNRGKGSLGTLAQLSAALHNSDFYILHGAGTGSGELGAVGFLPGTDATQSANWRVILDNIARMQGVI